MGKEVSLQGNVLLASHQACQDDGWFLPHNRGGVERAGGLCPPMGELSIILTAIQDTLVQWWDVKLRYQQVLLDTRISSPRRRGANNLKVLLRRKTKEDQV